MCTFLHVPAVQVAVKTHIWRLLCFLLLRHYQMSTETARSDSAMRRPILTLGWIAVLMGIIHILFVLPISDFRTGHIWFIGSGIAIIFAGFINILGQTNQKAKTTTLLVLISNLTMCLLFIVATFVLHEPQVYFGIVLFGALSVLTLVNK